MSSEKHPSTPLEELSARRSWVGPTLADGILTPDVAVFCQSGLSVVLGTRDPRSGFPVSGRGLGCRIDHEGRVRVMLRRTANEALLKALTEGAGIAVTFTKPSSHRSIQLKAGSARVVPAENEDGVAVEVQRGKFRDELIECGESTEFATIYCTSARHELTAIEFMPEQAFVQTPGPSAGSALKA